MNSSVGELSSQEIVSLNGAPVSTIYDDTTCTLSGHSTACGKVFLHFKFKGTFDKQVYREWRGTFLDILDTFKAHGHEAVYAMIPFFDERAVKFSLSFGFAPYAEYEHPRRGLVWILKRSF